MVNAGMNNEEVKTSGRIEDLFKSKRLIEPELEHTVLGNKPACILSIKSLNRKAVDYLTQLGFECVPTKNSFGSKPERRPSLLSIAKFEPATKYATPEVVEYFQQKFPRLRSRLDETLRLIDSQTVAQALAILCSFPRVDAEFDVSTSNLEKPEIAIVEGILLGYPLKDIAYYVRTRYMGEPKTPYVPLPSTEFQFIRDPEV